jgi:hypothetical protein
MSCRVIRVCRPAALTLLAGAAMLGAAAPGHAQPGVYWGAFVEPRGGLTRWQSFVQLESEVGRQFMAWRSNSGLDDSRLTGPFAQAMAARGGLYYLEVSAEVGPTCVTWKDVTAGAYDSELQQIAASIVAYGHRVDFAWNHEMQSNCATGTPAEYAASFEHVHRVFDAAGVRTVAYVFAPSATTFTQGAAAAYEPPRYDVVGVDGYNKARAWRTPSKIFSAAHTFAAARAKPLLIPEIGCQESAADPNAKAAWMTAAAQLFQSWAVAGVIWTNAVDQRLSINYWVDSSSQSLAAFSAAGSLPYFS